MKKILARLVAVVLLLICLSSCDMFDKNQKVTYETYENCVIFTFDYFEGPYTVELDRSVIGEGMIYYQVNLKHGHLTVNYKDVGYLHQEENLFEHTADDEMPVNGSGGYVEGNKIEISFGTLSPVEGEIIIAFTEDSLKAIHKDIQLHQHAITYISAGISGHFANYTCGCPYDHGAEQHYDGDNDYLCDYCKCDMTEFADEWQYDETHHWYVSDGGAVYCYGEHENFDADSLCDICRCEVSE